MAALARNAVLRLGHPACSRSKMTLTPAGAGGRASVSGITATVFGATGFLGRYVVNRLGKVGSQVVVPYRSDEVDCRHLRPMGDLGQVHFLNYRLDDEESIRKSVRFSNVVINLVGQDNDSRHWSLEDVHVEGARALARISAEEGVEQFIQVSALGASATSESRYYSSKAAGEDAVRQAFPSATIIRPAATFGIEDRFLNRLAGFRSVSPIGIPLVDFGTATKRPVYCADVARGIVTAITNQEAGATFEFAGPKSYSMEELAKFVCTSIKEPYKAVPVPQQALLLFARLQELSPLFDPLTTRQEVLKWAISEELSGVSQLEDLDITPTPLETRALTVLRRYRKHAQHDEILDA